MKAKYIVIDVLSWLFGVLVLANGIVNLFWGNDRGLGFLFLFLSLIYFPPLTRWLHEKGGYRVKNWMKLLTAVLIIWASGTVGALAEGFVF